MLCKSHEKLAFSSENPATHNCSACKSTWDNMVLSESVHVQNALLTVYIEVIVCYSLQSKTASEVIWLTLQVIADTYGNVKGTMSNPSADPPLREDGKLNVGAAVGRGVLAVVRSHPKNEHPYQGMIPIATGEVAEDLARYLADSEQTNSALALGVSINRDTSIRSAGGFLIQVYIMCTVDDVSREHRQRTV